MTDPREAPSRLAAALADQYRLERELGQGGMATVYLARDLKHDRDVAIKVLHPDLTAALGGDRFLAEIRTTARLQHPHILPLLDSGEADGLLFYAMPYVRGETLRARLERETQLPVGDAVRIAAEVADALGAAHDAGVVHRDIKPENVLLQGGHALVADFGIALAVQHAGRARMTQTGLSLGTPQYMSPEQAAGDRTVDARSDIYSLAAVTYEMLTGQPPHAGPSAQAIIARLITEPPRSPTAIRKTIPAHVERAVLVALEKLPADRFSTAHDFAAALTDPARTLSHPPVSVGGASPRRRTVLIAATAACVAALLTAAITAGVAHGGRSARDDAVLRLPIALADTVGRIYSGGVAVALSPAGDRLAITTAGNGPLRIVSLSDPVPRNVNGSEGAESPAFSPDGRELAFRRRNTVFRVAVDGGSVRTVADSAGPPAWGDRGTLFFRRGAELWSVPAGAAHGARLRALDSATVMGLRGLSVLPGEEYAVADWSYAPDRSTQLIVISLVTGHIDSLGVAGRSPLYSPTGHLVYMDSGGEVAAVPFSVRTRRVTGSSVAIGPRVRDNGLGWAHFAISRQSTLVEIPDEGANRMQMMLVSRNGDARPVSSELRAHAWVSVSPDGRHAATSVAVAASGPWALWVTDLASGALTRVTADRLGSRPEGWTPDGRDLYYLSGTSTSTVLVRPWDGSAPPREVLQLPAGILQGTVDRSGRRYLGHVGSTVTLAMLDSSAPPRVLIEDASLGSTPVISPDGNWIAYTSAESGRSAVYVRDVAGVAGRLRVSVNGGTQPLWTHDGSGVFYRDGATAWRADIARTPALTVTRRDSLFTGDFVQGPNEWWGVLPDDAHFVMFRDRTPPPHPLLVLGWTRLLR